MLKAYKFKEDGISVTIEGVVVKNRYRLGRAIQRSAFLVLKKYDKPPRAVDELKVVHERIVGHAKKLGWIREKPTERTQAIIVGATVLVGAVLLGWMLIVWTFWK